MTSYRKIKISPKFSNYIAKGPVKIKLKFDDIFEISRFLLFFLPSETQLYVGGYTAYL